MVKVKRKFFSFNETDLEWINPLIIEWLKENEGKKQSDLIVQLLRGFKLERDSIFTENDSQVEVITSFEKEKLDYFGRVREVLNTIFVKLESRMRRLLSKLLKGYEGFMGNIRKLKASERVRRLFARTPEETKGTRVEELEAEVERLQTIVKDLEAKLAKQEEKGESYEVETLATARAD